VKRTPNPPWPGNMRVANGVRITISSQTMFSALTWPFSLITKRRIPGEGPAGKILAAAVSRCMANSPKRVKDADHAAGDLTFAAVTRWLQPGPDRRMSDLIWYVAYGSNLSASRFGYYLHGGQPPGAVLTYPGARDRTRPRASKGVWIPGGVYFATESRAWGGGRALYDPGIPGRAAARAYLITAEQFSDVAEQEMYREPGADLDLAEIAARGRIQLGDGRYETMRCVGRDEHGPMVTFTAPWGSGDVPLLSPGASYLRLIGHGLREAHGWDRDQAAGYLAALPGARDAWTPGAIAALLDGGIG
jgi:hypothetical protein